MVKFIKINGFVFSSMPEPLSRTAKTASPPSFCSVTKTDSPAGENLTALSISNSLCFFTHFWSKSRIASRICSLKQQTVLSVSSERLSTFDRFNMVAESWESRWDSSMIMSRYSWLCAGSSS